MIKIFSIFINVSSLVFGFYSLFFILGRVNSFESGNDRIAEIQKEAVAISQQREKVKKDHALKFSKSVLRINCWKKKNLRPRGNTPIKIMLSKKSKIKSRLSSKSPKPLKRKFQMQNLGYFRNQKL